MKRIYLDNNATTALDPLVLEAMMEDLSGIPANPSSVHFFGREARKLLEKARSSIAHYFHAKPQEILFGSSATELLNHVLRGFHALHPRCRILSSNVEHVAVFKTLQALEKQGAKVTYLPAGLHGVVQPAQVATAIQETDLCVLASVNNETGAMLDLPAIAQLADSAGVPLIIDGVSHLGKQILHIPVGVAAMVFASHKIHGPKGTGFAVIRSTFKVPPLITGGHQEFGQRAGTENLAGILGSAKAVELLQHALPAATERMAMLRDLLIQKLSTAFGNVVIHGQGEKICNVANIAFPQFDGETLLMKLDLAGIIASHGSACASGGIEPSRILLNMEIPPALASKSIRFSLSRFTTQEDIEDAAAIIASLS